MRELANNALELVGLPFRCAHGICAPQEDCCDSGGLTLSLRCSAVCRAHKPLA